MVHRITLTGSVALMIFMGTLLFAGPAQAAGPCDTLTEGTQAYAQCMVRAEDREAAPIVPPAQEVSDPAPRVVEVSSTEVWQLALAGVLGAVVAIGLALGVSRLGHRQGVAAH